MIDPGHGGIKDGRYQTDGKMESHNGFAFYEGEFNRQLAEVLMIELRKRALSFVNLVPEKEDVPLHERVSRAKRTAKQYPKKTPVFLSIHANWFRDSSVTGIEVYTSPGETLSDRIANEFYFKLKNIGWNMRPGTGHPDKEAKFHVLWETPMAALLIEHGFFSNENQARKLLNPEVQRMFARLEAEAAKKCERKVKKW